MHINIICCSKKTYKHDTSLIASDRFETIRKLSIHIGFKVLRVKE